MDRLEPRRLMTSFVDTPIDLPTTGSLVTIAGNEALFYRNLSTDSGSGGIFNAATEHYSALALPPNMPGRNILGGEYDTGTVTVDGKTIFAGGFTPSGIIIGGLTAYTAVDSAYIYDHATGQFTTAQLSSPRGLITGVAVGHKAIFAAGALNDFPYAGYQPGSAAVDIYDAEQGTWSTRQLPYPAISMSAAVVGDQAFFDIGTKRGELTTYNATTNIWSTIQMPSPFFYEDLTSIGTKLMVIGNKQTQAKDGTMFLNRYAETYDTVKQTWSATSDLGPNGDFRYPVSHAVVGQNLIIGRGNRLQIYNMKKATWSVVRVPGTVAFYPPVASGRKVFFDAYDSTGLEEVAVYDTASRHWDIVKLSETRAVPTLQAVGNSVFVYGQTKRIDILTPVTHAPTAAFTGIAIHRMQ